MFGENSLRSLFDFGDAGVQFFFVLSGFIIYYIHRVDVGRPSRVSTFFKKRVIRIYPVYILVTLLLTPFWAFIPEFGAWYHKEFSAFVYSILLMPQSHVPNLGVGWTLTHEMLFYLLFSLIIISRKWGGFILVNWFASIIAINLIVRKDLGFPLSYFFSVNNLLFGLGILASIMVLRRRSGTDRGWLLVITGVLAFMVTGVGHNILNDQGLINSANSQLFILFFGLASFLVVLQSGSQSVERVLSKRKWLNVIGAASFSIYLIHQPVISLFRKLLELVGLHGYLGESLVFIAAMIISVSAGVVMYYLVERPMLRFFTRRYVRKPAAKVVPAVAVAIAADLQRRDVA